MPLDSQPEGVVEKLDGLDDAIGGTGDGARPRGEETNGLMVEAVNLDGWVAEDAPEEAMLIDLDRVSQEIARQAIGGFMIHATGVLILDILVDGATQGDVDQLDTAADAKNGEISLAEIGRASCRERV